MSGIAKLTSIVFAESTTNIDTGAANEYSSGWKAVGDYNKFVGFLYADQNCTVYLEQSKDKETVHVQSTLAVIASTTIGGFSVEVVAPYVRVKIRNTGGAVTTSFIVWARLSMGA